MKAAPSSSSAKAAGQVGEAGLVRVAVFREFAGAAAGGVERRLVGLDHEGREPLRVRVAVGDERPLIRLDRHEYVALEPYRSATPDEDAAPHLDRGPELPGELLAGRAGGAVGGDHQVGIAAEVVDGRRGADLDRHAGLLRVVEEDLQQPGAADGARMRGGELHGPPRQPEGGGGEAGRGSDQRVVNGRRLRFHGREQRRGQPDPEAEGVGRRQPLIDRDLPIGMVAGQEPGREQSARPAPYHRDPALHRAFALAFSCR